MHRLLLPLLLVICSSNIGLGRILKQDIPDTLTVYWYTSRPFIFQDELGAMQGLESEMIQLFAEFLQAEKDKKIYVDWKMTQSFGGILSQVKNMENSSALGASALSITDDRKEFASFSTPYLPEITVLISSEGTRIVGSYDEIDNMVESMEAVTIRGTKYESLLLDLKEQLSSNFKINYLGDDGNIIDGIKASGDRFGFVDLPIYLMQVKEGEQLTRQNFFNVKGEGYAFILSQNSPWKLLLDEFIEDPVYSQKIADIIASYLGQELYKFMDEINSGNEISTSILTKEKELQLALIKNANLKLEEEQLIQDILLVGIGIVGGFFFVIAYLFYRNRRSNKIVIGQKDQISTQQEDIRMKNESLMNRNAQLMNINEEKNNLMKILAHDIRSPLSQIIMITEILKNPSDSAVDMTKDLLKQIGTSAERINEMVSKILDVDNLENESIKVMRERVDVHEILMDIKSRYEDQSEKKGIQLIVKSCKKNNIIRTDHLLLTLVLENLVSNAIKFSPLETRVVFEADCKYDGVVFKISDEGPGFTDEDKGLLFNRFQKLSAKPTGGEASIGLGLSIVKKYVSDMGGQIWLESEKDKGSTFFVKLGI